MLISPSPIKAPGIQSILVIHQGALGDFILALPALESLRQAFPHAKSVIMGYPRILELVEKRFYAEEVLSVDQKGMASFFVREGTLDFPLSQYFETFDLIIVFGKEGEGTVIGNLRRVCQGRILHINSFPPWDEKVHLTDHLLKQFAQYGFPASGSIPKLHLKESDREWAGNFWEGKGVTPEERSKVVILHPGSGSKKKVWPLDRFLNLAHTLQDRLGSRILIVLGPAEGPEVQKAFEGIGPPAPILARGLTLLQLASVMEGCWFFVGNDSGISHMAAALGLPTVVIFGPTDQRVWSPRGEKTVVVSRDVYCSPCPQERLFQCKDLECLRGIEIGEVLGGLGKIGIPFKSWKRRNKMEEKKVGEIIKYFGKINVAAIRLSEGSLKVGDTIHMVGHTTDVTQTIDSMQIENKNVQEAGPGADIGIKVKDRVREHDIVYKVVE